MKDKDYILRASAADGTVRAFFANTVNTVNTAAAIHKTTPVVSAALGRLLTAGLIMGLMLKDDSDLLTLSIKGDGPVNGLLVTADSKGRVKGYANNPNADAPIKQNGKLNVSGVIGKGTLTVIKDMGFNEPYNGTVNLQSGEVAEDIAYYFFQSEQTPSVVSLGVLVDRDWSIRQSGGFFIQLMPGAKDDVIEFLENKINTLESITNLYENKNTPETLAGLLFDEIGYEILERTPVEYYCNCSRERMEKALISIGKDSLEEIIAEDKSAELNCHFCNKKYSFSESDLMALLLSFCEKRK